ncbi:MAG: tetratricopeptide repeat protein [Ktedonobacteraceae bacterium]
MSEQEREPDVAGGSELPTSQEGDRLQQGTPGGGIHAETITKTTNVVSGAQYIGTQINYGSGGPSQQRLPLQRPRRAEHFVDREAERARLLADLKAGRVVTVCGLGGMGKTALVAEVLWTLAPAETAPAAFPDGLLFYSFYGQPVVTIALEQLARVLGEEPVPTPALATQRALSGRRVLLVLDGAEEADHLGQMLAVCGDSAVLLTTRRRGDAPDPAYRIDLQALPEHEAVRVVQAFGGEQAADMSATSRICECVGNLPLALRLVGRYLAEQEEEASAYLAWLQNTPLSALDQGTSRQESVPVLLERTTLRLSATAQQVLRLVGLLALSAFDRELVAQTLELSEEDARRALAELVNYGLLVRQQSRYEVSHPLIHTYAREGLVAQDDAAAQGALLERLVRVLDKQFPEVEYANWRRCEALLPHVQACATLIAQQQVILLEAGYLLNRAGWYLREPAQFTQAVHLLQQALTLAERALGSDDTYLGVILTNLAQLYRDQGPYAKAESLFQRSLAIYEQALPPDHPYTATTLNHLAQFYREQGRYAKAESLFHRALAIYEQALPPHHPDIATNHVGLALLYQTLGRHAEAESLFHRALAIYEQALPPHHPDIATNLQSLARLYQDQGRYAEAEPLYQRALAIREKVLPPDHPDIAATLDNLAQFYLAQGCYVEAEPLFQRSLIICEQALPPDHPDIATNHAGLAQLYWAQGRHAEAELLLQRALAIYEQAFSPHHPYTGTVLHNLAYLYREQGHYAEAEPLFQRSLTIKEKALPPDHPDTAITLENYAYLLREMNRPAEAQRLEGRTGAMRDRLSSKKNI